MNIKRLLLGSVTALALAAAAATPAAAAKLQRFWVFNFSGLDIYHVYALNDQGHGTRDLMGSDGILYYNPNKVPDQVLVLAPNRRGNQCISDIKIVGYDSNDDQYTAYAYDVDLCMPGQTINVFDSDFN